MACFKSCCNGFESHKDGAFEKFRETNKAEHSRSFIPWIWSRKFHRTYQVGDVLGQGSFAVVHEATKVEPPHEPYAVKIIKRYRMDNIDLRHFNDEVLILLDLNHNNIIRLHELYRTSDLIYVVLEKLDGGELFERLCEKAFYSEMEARDVCRTVFEAMAYCHGERVAHRDLKPENLLLVSRDNDSHVKVADFGFAKRVPRPNSLTTRCGSAAYTAPEIANALPYDERVDNWSLGCIVYTMLGGFNPFQEDTTHLTFQRIREGYFQFEPAYWDGISPDAKKLIKGLLTRDTTKRVTVENALSHPWMIGRGDDLKNNSVNLKELKKYTAKRKKEAQVRSVSMYWLFSRR